MVADRGLNEVLAFVRAFTAAKAAAARSVMAEPGEVRIERLPLDEAHARFLQGLASG